MILQVMEQGTFPTGDACYDAGLDDGKHGAFDSNTYSMTIAGLLATRIIPRTGITWDLLTGWGHNR